MQANIRLEHELLAAESEHRVYAMLELVAPHREPSTERPPLNLVLVIDCSSSMPGPKLDVTKRCAAYLARRLAPNDPLDASPALLSPVEWDAAASKSFHFASHSRRRGRPGHRKERGS